MKRRYLLLVSVVSVTLGSAAFAAAQKDTPEKGDTPEAHSSPAAPEDDSRIVRIVEQKLRSGGYRVGSVDGEWDPETKAAVTQFQKAEGLNATGLLDQDTLRVLGVDK